MEQRANYNAGADEDKHREFILATDRSFVAGLKTPICKDVMEIQARFDAINGNLIIRQRRELDVKESPLPYLQLLPYYVLKHTDDMGVVRFFTYQRTKMVGEERLAKNFSIGVGGHIDLKDVVGLLGDDSVINIYDVLFFSALRELSEELAGVKVPRLQRGHELPDILITDNSDDVGRHHLGLMYLLNVEGQDIECAEEELDTIGFRTLDELFNLGDKLESWSRLLLEPLADEGFWS